MKALVTGGSGFIGRNILITCREEGWDTVSLDLIESDYGDVNIMGSVLDQTILKQAFKDVDVVFHEAAVTSPPQFEAFPSEGFNVNSQGTFNVLEEASEAGVSKVILASSSALYGNSKQISRENQVDLDFKNVYPMTKYFNEMTAKFFSENTSLQTVCLRYFNAYGVGENSKGFYSSPIDKFIKSIQRGERPVIFGDGTQSRDFIYVKDIAKANIKAAENGKSGESYNVGTGVTTSFNDIYKLIRNAFDSDLEPIYSPVPYKSYQLFTQADMTKATHELKFKPEYDLRKGINEIAEYAETRKINE